MPDADRRALYSGIIDRLSVLPGVTSVSLSTMTPLNTVGTYRGVVIPGEPETPEARGVYSNQVSEAYFRTIGVRLLQGRTFDAGEVRTGANVVVLNARAARHIFKGANPIGQTTAWLSSPGTPLTVIGVVEDSSRDSPREDPPRMVYSPLTVANSGAVQVAIKTTAARGPLVTEVRELIRRGGRDVVVDRIRTMEDQMNASVVRERGLAWLATAFAVLAAMLSLVGLYGVMSYRVARRTREFGIRLAIGARPGAVLGGVLGESLWLTAAGIGIGLIGDVVCHRRRVELPLRVVSTRSDDACRRRCRTRADGTRRQLPAGAPRRANRSPSRPPDGLGEGAPLPARCLLGIGRGRKIAAFPDVARDWHAHRSVRSRRDAGRRWHGRGLPGARSEARA